MRELRYCDRCLTKTDHIVLNDEDALYNPRGRATYKCAGCGRVRRMRQLRPSSESSY